MKLSSILTIDDDEGDLFICSYTIRKFDQLATARAPIVVQ